MTTNFIQTCFCSFGLINKVFVKLWSRICISSYIQEKNKHPTAAATKKDGYQPGERPGHCQHGAGVQRGDGRHGDGWGLGHLPGRIPDVEKSIISKLHLPATQTGYTDINYSAEDINQSKDQMETKSPVLDFKREILD